MRLIGLTRRRRFGRYGVRVCVHIVRANPCGVYSGSGSGSGVFSVVPTVRSGRAAAAVAARRRRRRRRLFRHAKRVKLDMGKIACNRNRAANTVRQQTHYALTRSELLARITKMVSIISINFSSFFANFFYSLNADKQYVITV